MLRTSVYLILFAVLLVSGCSKVYVRPGDGETEDEQPPMHWSYEGETGPEHWAEAYPDCSGSAQSPIDIAGAGDESLPPLEFTYLSVEGKIVDTGHALQVDSDGGALAVDDRSYILQQLHFHVPSEHTVDGRRFDAVMHLVHAGGDDRLLVVAIPLVEGEENDFIEDVLDAAASEDPTAEVDLEDVVPKSTAYYTYNGSLTTPPCTEGVRWYVLQNPVTLSEEQLDDLAGFYVDNVRPIQATNERNILRSAE